MKRNFWSVSGRMVDEAGVPWLILRNQDGSLLKAISQDCHKGDHPIRIYARSSAPGVWYWRLRDLEAGGPTWDLGPTKEVA